MPLMLLRAPRVSSDYGYFVEEVLSLRPVQAVADAYNALVAFVAEQSEHI